MVQTKVIKPLEIIHTNCCGIDIHKDSAVVCLSFVDKATGLMKEEIKTFSCFTDDLQKMKQWLTDHDCSVVSLESTGVYWRPVHNILENDMEVILVNARHFKNVPGRKTDVNDSQWLCNLLRHGLLRGSFIPPAQVREWRELTRLRRNLGKDQGNYKRQAHKVFQTANIKIDSVVSDLFGVTGCHLMDLLCEDREITLEEVKQCTRGTLSKKAEELYRSLQGFFTNHHRYQIQMLRRLIDQLTLQIISLDEHINQLMGGHEDVLVRLKQIPGVKLKSAQVILSEIGFDLESFETAQALSSWAGVSPGNHQSAGKSSTGKSPVKKHVFKEALIQMAWAAIKQKGSFWKDKYYSLKTRRGAQRAIVAIAHKMLRVMYRIIKHKDSYQEMNQIHKDKQQERKIKRMKKQAELLGFQLTSMEPI